MIVDASVYHGLRNVLPSWYIRVLGIQFTCMESSKTVQCDNNWYYNTTHDHTRRACTNTTQQQCYITDGLHVAEHNVFTDSFLVSTVIYGSSLLNVTASDVIEEQTDGDKSDVSIEQLDGFHTSNSVSAC